MWDSSIQQSGLRSVVQSCLTVWDPMDCSLPGSSVYGIFQARILEWVAISSSRGSSWPRDWTRVSCIGRQMLYHWATREAHATIVIEITSINVGSLQKLLDEEHPMGKAKWPHFSKYNLFSQEEKENKLGLNNGSQDGWLVPGSWKLPAFHSC